MLIEGIQAQRPELAVPLLLGSGFPWGWESRERCLLLLARCGWQKSCSPPGDDFLLCEKPRVWRHRRRHWGMGLWCSWVSESQKLDAQQMQQMQQKGDLSLVLILLIYPSIEA